MNKFMLSAAVLAALAFNATMGATRPKLTPEQRRAKIYARTGGIINRPMTGKAIKFVNMAGLSTNTLVKIANSLQSGLFFPMTIADKAMTPKEALDGQTGFALLFVKTGGPRLLVAPEDGWAQVDVTSLESSNAKVFDERLMKESWRAIAYALGGGNTHFPQCVMKPIVSVPELHANSAYAARLRGKTDATWIRYAKSGFRDTSQVNPD